MTAFNPIPLLKLYNMAKKAKYDGYGHKIVYIDARKKYRQELVQYYKDIRTVFNKGSKWRGYSSMIFWIETWKR